MKILIVGIVASGKTTMASELSDYMTLPWYELDSIVYSIDGGTRSKRSVEEQKRAIMDIDQSGGWVFEGVYRASYHYLFDMADRIIFLDPPLYVRRFRIIKRYLKQRLGMESCHYRPDLKMLRSMFRWTKDFENDRMIFEEMLEVYRNKLIVIKNARNKDYEFYDNLIGDNIKRNILFGKGEVVRKN